MDTNIAAELLERHHDFDSARPLVDVEGLSSARVCNFLNQLVRHMAPGERYLEIGTFKGRTLISAAHGNFDRVCIGCDHFRFWGRYTGPGVLAKRAFYDNVKRHRGHGARIEFFDMSSKRLFSGNYVAGPIGVFFYDGDHSYAGTRHGVESVAPHLAKRSVLLMDDWNDPEIRRATFNGIQGARLGVLWHRALAGDHSERGFWNGLGVFYLERAA